MPADPAAVARAQASLARARAQAGALGAGGSGKKKPSILGRVFDVLSRPLYGVSEGIARASEYAGPDNPRTGKGNAGLDILKGIAGGLAGKNKTDMTEALQRSAEANKHSLLSSAIRGNKYNIKTIGGLVGNVGLDPLTYVAPEITLAAAPAEVAHAGAEAGLAAARTAEATKAIEEARHAAMISRGTKLAAKGVEEGKAVKSIEAAGKAAEKGAIKGFYEPARLAGEAAAKTPGEIGLRLGTKAHGVTVGSEKAYNAVAGVGKALKATKTGAALNESFRTGAKFPEVTNMFRRESQIAGIARTNEMVRSLEKEFSGLTSEERRQISHAIEAGATDTGPSHLHGITAKNGKDLGEYVDKAKEISRTLIEEEKKAKIPFNEIAEGTIPDTYVPHYYEDKAAAAKAAKKMKAVGSDVPGFTHGRVFPTLKDAAGAGLKPEEDIVHALSQRIRGGSSAIARRDFVTKVVDAAGVEAKNAGEKAALKEAGFKELKGMPGVNEGTFVPEHYHKTLMAHETFFKDDEAAKHLLGLYDKALHNMKFGISGLSPGHYMRRGIAGVWQNFMDGVSNPKRYAQAVKLMHTDVPEKMAFKVGDQIVHGGEVQRLQRAMGAEGAFFSGEFGASPLTKFKSKAYRAAEKADQVTRTAHFIDALKDEGKGAKSVQDVEEAARRAGARVRKWNGDFGDLTPFEKKFVKRLVPFYSFSKELLPRQIEAIAMRPGKVLGIPKGINAIQTMLGTGQGYNKSSLQVMPDWLREAASVELPGAGNFLRPSVPFQNISQFTEGGTKGVLGNLFSQLTPALRIPGELGTGTDAFTGAPIKSTPKYLSSQLPILTEIYDAIKGAKTGKHDIPALTRYLGASGWYHITPEQQAAQMGAEAKKLRSAISGVRKKARTKQ
jgi:hypothetical protein